MFFLGVPRLLGNFLDTLKYKAFTTMHKLPTYCAFGEKRIKSREKSQKKRTNLEKSAPAARNNLGFPEIFYVLNVKKKNFRLLNMSFCLTVS